MIDGLSIDELDEKYEMQSLTYDIMLKNLFLRNEYILRLFLISVLHLDIRPNECKIHFVDKELPIANCYEYKKTLDFNVSINDCLFINVKLNKSSFKYLKQKYINQINRQSINDIVKYTNIQLILNYCDKSNNLGEDIVVSYSIKTNSIYIDNDVIYLKYLDYYYHLYHNENIKKVESDYWLAMLMAKNFTELNDILSRFLPDNLREKIVKDVYDLSIEKFVLEDIKKKTLDFLGCLIYSKKEISISDQSSEEIEKVEENMK